MASQPHKFVRFIVWATASRKDRDDALTALDEGFESAQEKFGPAYAHWWSIWQGLRAVPYGLIALVVKFVTSIFKIGS